MTTKTSMHDIALRAKVSRATVSYVLNSRDNAMIGEKTRQRVLDAARELGYKANRVARTLASGRSYLVELWTHGVHPAYCGAIIAEIARVLDSTPYELRIVQTGISADTKHGVGGEQWPVDGIIALDTPEMVERHVGLRAAETVPVVSVGLGFSSHVDHVGIDVLETAVEAVRHLVSLGCERIAYVVPGPANTDTNPRREAYRRGISDAGIACEIIVADTGIDGLPRDLTRGSVRRHIDNHGLPDALFCYNDETAIAALRALLDAGVRVPRDVAVVGCDGIEETAYYNPPISTIALPIQEMCREAWQFLERRIREPKTPRQARVLRPRFLVRESSSGHARRAAARSADQSQPGQTNGGADCPLPERRSFP